MKRTKKSQLLFLMLTMLCLFLCVMPAAADETWMPENYTLLKPASKERILAGMPKGLVANCTVTDGMIEYVIDADATDWESVLAYSYQASSGQAYIRPGITPPDGAARQRSVGYSVDPGVTDKKLVRDLENNVQQNGTIPGDAIIGYWIGRYDEETSTYIPVERDKRPQGIAVLWYDEAGNFVGGEYLLFRFVYTDPDARSVRMTRVSESDITLNVPAFISNHGTTLLAGKEGGVIRYEVPNPQELQSFIATTAIAAPQIDGKDVSGWTCYMRTAFGSDFSPCTMADAGEYGLTRRSALINSMLQNTTHTEQTSWMLDWRDEQGQSQYVALLPSVVICGDPAPWPVYAGWKPVPENRVRFTYVNPIESGTRLTYNADSGVAYFHINPHELPETAAYGDAHYVMEFTPPAGAAAYSVTNGNSSNAFGPKSYMVQNTQHSLSNSERHLCSEGFTMEQGVFEPHRQESRDLTIFMTALMPGEFSAEYAIINWYRDVHDAEPMSTEYIFRQMDSCLLQHVSAPYNSEEELPKVITAPVVVIPSENSAAEMQFIAELYPIEGENSRYYELRLVDEKGKSAMLPAKAKIILSYPEGTSFDAADIIFNLRHLNNKYQTFETFSVEEGNLHLEEGYLWFTPSSLSPFVLEWTQVNNPAETVPGSDLSLPDTGDPSWPLALLALLFAAGSTLFVQLRRRKI